VWVAKYYVKSGNPKESKRRNKKMSRIGRLPVTIPAGVQINLNGSEVEVKGPKGVMKKSFSPQIEIVMEEGRLIIKRSSEEQTVRALHGTTRSILNNMVLGVSQGFNKVLEIDGVGYRAEMDGKNLVIYVGFSHPVTVEPPDGINFSADAKTRQININGYDKELVGLVAADIRKIRPPEPYKGKGIHYLGERLRHKAGKSAKTAV
jgi:large subunit ribosomal protein L6